VGIEKHFLQRTGLNFSVMISEVNDYIKSLSTGKRRIEGGTVYTGYYNDISSTIRRIAGLPRIFMGFIDSSDLFRGNRSEETGVDLLLTHEEKRITGYTNRFGGIMTLLDRAIRKGSMLEGAYLDMSYQQKVEYIGLVAAHEAYHLLGFLDDLNQGLHAERGLPDLKNCLGYSRFEIPSEICPGCVNGIQAYWYGTGLRTGKQYLNLGKCRD